MRVICTGGGGFIGTNLRQEIGKWSESSFISIDSNVANVSLSEVILDLNTVSINDLSDIFQDADAVVHLAAGSGVVTAELNPSSIVEYNVQATVKVAVATKIAAVPKFVFTSTCGAIAGNNIDVIDELTQPHPISLYGASKLAAEVFLRTLFLNTNIDAYVFRLSNVFGPYSFQKSNLIPAIARQLVDPESSKAIEIRGDGTAVRDFVYVEDVCSAIVKVLSRPISDGGCQVKTYNLSSGQSMSVNQVLDLMGALAGQKVRATFLEPRPEEALTVRASSAKAERELAWTASTQIETALSKTIESFRSYAELRL